MTVVQERRVTGYAIWALRVALFSLALVCVAILLHRFFWNGDASGA